MRDTPLYDVKEKPQLELCAPLEIWVLMANYCTRCRGIFKGLLHDGDRLIFLKTSAPRTLMTTYQRNLIQPDPSRRTVPSRSFCCLLTKLEAFTPVLVVHVALLTCRGQILKYSTVSWNIFNYLIFIANYFTPLFLLKKEISHRTLFLEAANSKYFH